jgi:uncharacterized protein (TIGR02246 family)
VRVILTITALALATAHGLSAQVAVSASPRPEPAAALDTSRILASARPDIDAANAAWLPGLRKHDAQAIAAAYSNDGLFIARDGIVTRGRSAIARMYAARFPKLRDIRAGAVVQGGLAVLGQMRIAEWGNAWLEIAPETKGGMPVRSGGTYLTIWQRETDGHWRIVRNLAF